MRNKKIHSVVLSLILAAGISASACTGTQKKGDPDVASGFVTALKGVGHLVLSPVQITVGLLEGVAALPYFAATNLHKLNAQLNKTQAKVTLDDTYEAAYGRRLSTVGADGDTGRTFRRMKHATVFFQRILKQYGVRSPENYILTSVDTASDKGYVLFAVVRRSTRRVVIKDKERVGYFLSYTPGDRLYYEPYQVDRAGKKLDEIVDFGGVAMSQVRGQKMQAILLTLAANSVVRNKRSPNYWKVQKRWMSGEHIQVMREHNLRINKHMEL